MFLHTWAKEQEHLAWEKNGFCICFLFIIYGCICVSPDKVNDPMMAVQIEWMMEVPELYRQCYDKPFKLHPDASG